MTISRTAIFVASLLMTSLSDVIAVQNGDDGGTDATAMFDTNSGKIIAFSHPALVYDTILDV